MYNPCKSTVLEKHNIIRDLKSVIKKTQNIQHKYSDRKPLNVIFGGFSVYRYSKKLEYTKCE